MLLHRHEMKNLRSFYARTAKVRTTFGLPAKSSLVMRDAAEASRERGDSLPTVDGWGADGPFTIATSPEWAGGVSVSPLAPRPRL